MDTTQLNAKLAAYEQAAERELTDGIMAWWLKYAYLPQSDTYAGLVDYANHAHPDAPLHCVLTARYLWGFSAMARHSRDELWLRQAHIIYGMYINLFKDRQYGGAYWEVSPDGTVLSDRKEMYGNAFWIYGLSEYYLAGGPKDALDEAIALFECMMRYAHDDANGGIFEAFERDWTPSAYTHMSAGIEGAVKTMNTHLHLLEAFTNLLRAWDAPQIRDMTAEMLNCFLDHVTNPQGYFRLYFTADYKPLPDEVSYGHDIEGSWLLWEAAEVIGDEALLEKARPYCIALCERPYRMGLDAIGGLVYEAEVDGTPKRDERVWWSQAEACVGLLNGYELTGDEKYLEASLLVWEFIDRHMIDHQNGEWFAKTDSQGKPYSKEDKGNGWKAPYHNARCCMEVANRCRKLRKET